MLNLPNCVGMVPFKEHWTVMRKKVRQLDEHVPNRILKQFTYCNLLHRKYFKGRLESSEGMVPIKFLAATTKETDEMA